MLTARRFGDWEAALRRPQPDAAYPFLRGIWHFSRGSALVSRGAISGAARELAAVTAIADSEEMARLKARVNPASTLLTLAEHVLSAEIAARGGDYESALAHFEAGVRIEDGLKYVEPPDWGHPVRHEFGALLLAIGRVREAETVYWEDLRRNPENGWSLHGVWRSRLHEGREEGVAEVQERFRRAWADADVNLIDGRPRIPQAPSPEAAQR